MSVWDENICVVVHPLNEFSTRIVDALTNSSNWLDLYDIVFYHNTRNNTLSFKVRYRRTSKKALSICVKGSKMWKLSRNVNVLKKMLKASLLNNYKF